MHFSGFLFGTLCVDSGTFEVPFRYVTHRGGTALPLLEVAPDVLVQRNIRHDDGVEGRGLVVAVLGTKVKELVRLADALGPLPLGAGGGPLPPVGRDGAGGAGHTHAQCGGAAQAQQLRSWIHTGWDCWLSRRRRRNYWSCCCWSPDWSCCVCCCRVLRRDCRDRAARCQVNAACRRYSLTYSLVHSLTHQHWGTAATTTPHDRVGVSPAAYSERNTRFFRSLIKKQQ